MATPRMIGMPSKPIPIKDHKNYGQSAVADKKALGKLLANKNKLSRQQYKTLKGQILNGDADGAMRGLEKLINKAVKE